MNFPCTATSFTVALLFIKENHMGSLSCAYSPPAYAKYNVPVHQLAVLRPAFFRSGLTVKPLPFASSCRLIAILFSTVIFLDFPLRTFVSLVRAHAGRTQENLGDTYGEFDFGVIQIHKGSR